MPPKVQCYDMGFIKQTRRTYLRRCEEQIRLVVSLYDFVQEINVRVPVQPEVGGQQVRARVVGDLKR